MSAMITSFIRASSLNAQAAMWGTAELGLGCERRDDGNTFGGPDSPEFRAMSPQGRVPVIRGGKLEIGESRANQRHLAARPACRDHVMLSYDMQRAKGA